MKYGIILIWDLAEKSTARKVRYENMLKITEILASYDTDKEIFHRYGQTYEKIFAKFDREAPLNILEIGTQKGGSLLAWKEYFPNSNVYGVDTIDVVPEEYRKDTVMRIISDIKEWKNDIEWDIVIDDGSHYLMDLAYVIPNYCIKLKMGGALIIEDVRNPNLLLRVIENLFGDISIGFPNAKQNAYIDIKCYDTSAVGAEGSFIIALFKEAL